MRRRGRRHGIVVRWRRLLEGPTVGRYTRQKLFVLQHVSSVEFQYTVVLSKKEKNNNN